MCRFIRAVYRIFKGYCAILLCLPGIYDSMTVVSSTMDRDDRRGDVEIMSTGLPTLKSDLVSFPACKLLSLSSLEII